MFLRSSPNLGPGPKPLSTLPRTGETQSSPRLGKKLARDVTKHDVATLSNDIVAGRHGGKPSISNARHMRRAASGLFNWAAEAGREYVTASPCVNLPKLDREHSRSRVLAAANLASARPLLRSASTTR